MNLPEKTLKDYYQLIENPMSLKKMWRAIQGMQGRGGATGVSLYKSWATMEQEANLLWTNAQYYNEEGSEIYELAGELKVNILKLHFLYKGLISPVSIIFVGRILRAVERSQGLCARATSAQDQTSSTIGGPDSRSRSWKAEAYHDPCRWRQRGLSGFTSFTRWLFPQFCYASASRQ